MELPEDADDKVRRNLVSFSAAVLLLGWLQVPLQKVLEKVGVSDPVPAWRAWAAAGAVLIYLWARFHCNGQGRDFVTKLKGKFDDQVYGYLHRRIGARPLREDVAAWISPRPVEVLQRGTQNMKEAAVAAPDAVPEVFFNGERWKWTGSYRLNVQWIEGASRFVKHQYAEDVSYRVPMPVAAMLWLRALWFSWFFSAEALSWVSPVALAALAGGVIVVRLASELGKVAGW
jgi:hypothetical protein